jgi:hypothetical protein
MGPWILAAVAILAGFFVLPALLDRLPRSESRGGGLGPMLSDLNAIFNPTEQQGEAVRRQRPAERSNNEPKDD